MSAYTDALTRCPAGLGPKHHELGRLLLGNPEGITRQQGVRRLGLDGKDPDRKLRDLVADIVAAAWLPIVNDRGDTNNREGRYRIARSDEVDAVNREAAEIQARAMSLHARGKGLRDAFQAHHHAGSLFLPEAPDLEVA